MSSSEYELDGYGANQHELMHTWTVDGDAFSISPRSPFHASPGDDLATRTNCTQGQPRDERTTYQEGSHDDDWTNLGGGLRAHADDGGLRGE
ncbi:hypothetical protein AB3662_44995 [Sorangium cellulosum]|uniref:hypothetical protein n=1 Tax=Sorangium cellulosum TaxID=56 RepID=UPI003D9A0DBA